jgi:hypothetical protein
MSGDKVDAALDTALDAALDVFRQTYQKVVPGADDVIPGTEGAVMSAIYTFVLRESGILSDIEKRANKFMPILTAWNAVKKARIEAAKADKARFEADEAEKV